MTSKKPVSEQSWLKESDENNTYIEGLSDFTLELRSRIHVLTRDMPRNLEIFRDFEVSRSDLLEPIFHSPITDVFESFEYASITYPTICYVTRCNPIPFKGVGDSMLKYRIAMEEKGLSLFLKFRDVVTDSDYDLLNDTFESIDHLIAEVEPPGSFGVDIRPGLLKLSTVLVVLLEHPDLPTEIDRSKYLEFLRVRSLYHPAFQVEAFTQSMEAVDTAFGHLFPF